MQGSFGSTKSQNPGDCVEKASLVAKTDFQSLLDKADGAGKGPKEVQRSGRAEEMVLEDRQGK